MTDQKSNEGLCTLGELIETQKGFAFKSAWFSKQGRKIVKVSDFTSNSIDLSSLAHIAEELAQKYERYKLFAGDVLIQTVGSWPSNPASVVGKVVRVPFGAEGALLNQNAVKLTPLPGVHKAYLYYALKSSAFSDYIVGTAQGAASQASVTLDSIRGYCVALPSFPNQNRIASVLSAYDDLIENNTRRIEILEEMARRLYEEWFVQFRFPGCEEVLDTDGLPQGWKCSPLSEIASYIGRGISPKYDEEADCRVINQKCIRNQRLDVRLSRRQSKRVPAEKLIQLGDILINSTGVGTLGRVAQVHEVLDHMTVDSHVTIVRAGEFVDVDYFGSTLLSLQHFFEWQGVGSTGQTELSRSRIAETYVIVPPYELQARFGKSIRSMRLLCAQLAKKNSNLRAQRDLLLPKLISGEIDVSDTPMPT